MSLRRPRQRASGVDVEPTTAESSGSTWITPCRLDARARLCRVCGTIWLDAFTHGSVSIVLRLVRRDAGFECRAGSQAASRKRRGEDVSEHPSIPPRLHSTRGRGKRRGRDMCSCRAASVQAIGSRQLEGTERGSSASSQDGRVSDDGTAVGRRERFP